MNLGETTLGSSVRKIGIGTSANDYGEEAVRYICFYDASNTCMRSAGSGSETYTYSFNDLPIHEEFMGIYGLHTRNNSEAYIHSMGFLYVVSCSTCTIMSKV